jgi:hypothetical protein
MISEIQSFIILYISFPKKYLKSEVFTDTTGFYASYAHAVFLLHF